MSGNYSYVCKLFNISLLEFEMNKRKQLKYTYVEKIKISGFYSFT